MALFENKEVGESVQKRRELVIKDKSILKKLRSNHPKGSEDVGKKR